MRFGYQLNEGRAKFWQHPILWCVAVLLGLVATVALIQGDWFGLLIWLGLCALAIRAVYARGPKDPTFKH